MTETGALPPAQLRLETVPSIEAIAARDWNRFAGDDNPLVGYQFLYALEASGCTSASSGWQPCHLRIYLDEVWVGVAPGYLKSHSMGEYVFDWAWADAWRRYGQPYYPKLLIAVPFTPCQGPRLLLTEEARQQIAPGTLHQALDQLMGELGAHSWHLLFPDEKDQKLLSWDPALHRLGCQFHWFNRDYRNFEEFLATLTSRKRKSLRKERQRVADQGIDFEWHQGNRLDDAVLDHFFLFYQATYLKRGQSPYLNRGFFERLARELGSRLRIITAHLATPDGPGASEKQGNMIAAALFIVGSDTLYGRYWGCLEDYSHLHFETCYYQGIELAIELGLNRFDAGAQGEHKLVRGFEPVLTHSWHGIANPGFQEAVRNFCAEEAADVKDYQAAAHKALPYRQDDIPTASGPNLTNL